MWRIDTLRERVMTRQCVSSHTASSIRKTASMVALLTALTFASVSAVAAQPGSCSADSGTQRVAVVELFTSQGCSSCPPTDRYVSELPAKGLASDRLIVLAMHVDYWNRLGWRDPFSQAAFTERQREISGRKKAGYLYTPQLVLDGQDHPQRRSGDDLPGKVAAINRQAAQARISIEAVRVGNGLQVSAQTRLSPAAAANASSLRSFVAVYENGVSTVVRTGENAGKTLKNDFIVRSLSGPGPAGSATEAGRVNLNWPLAADARSERLVAVAFVQNIVTGEVLQAVSLPVCAAA